MRLRFKEVKGITHLDVEAIFAQVTNAKVTAIRFDGEFIEVVLDEDHNLSAPDFWTLEDETEEDDGEGYGHEFWDEYAQEKEDEDL